MPPVKRRWRAQRRRSQRPPWNKMGTLWRGFEENPSQTLLTLRLPVLFLRKRSTARDECTPQEAAPPWRLPAASPARPPGVTTAQRSPPARPRDAAAAQPGLLMASHPRLWRKRHRERGHGGGVASGEPVRGAASIWELQGKTVGAVSYGARCSPHSHPLCCQGWRGTSRRPTGQQCRKPVP